MKFWRMDAMRKAGCRRATKFKCGRARLAGMPLRWGLAVMLGILTAAGNLPAQGSGPTEYQVKAAYLYNFGLFVSWPRAEKSGTEPFDVCILGKDPFGPALDSIFAGEVLHGQKVSVRRIADSQGAPGCRILFVSRSEAKQLKTILLALNAGVLTVSDMPDFVNRGGIIQFVREGEKIRFEVNLTAAKSAGLSLSSDLLKVAAAVRTKTTPGPEQ